MSQSIEIQKLKYEIDFYTAENSQYIESDCNSLVFINKGTSNVIIENVLLYPSQSLAIDGNLSEYTTQRFFVNFGTSTTGNNCVIIRKRYILR
jgi:hypothetical protein